MALRPIGCCGSVGVGNDRSMSAAALHLVPGSPSCCAGEGVPVRAVAVITYGTDAR
jgi:hypothetical protein